MQPEEELMSSLGQILARMEVMQQEQAEENRRLLESLQGPPVLRATPEPQEPSELPAFEPSEVRIPEVQESSEVRIPEVQEPSDVRIPEVQGPSELQTSEVQEPAERRTPEPAELRTSEPQAALPTTPVPQDPSAEGRPWFWGRL
ncbi:hypothetical protein EYF80_062586 [Liparis tanakae]|uniref:Uncharacterized protein n=1 Tax=Liparis tanakae TaxID=230148 RepID=A0A4Z2EFF9_9TELE|nr:hypothetical protein EYF80_062586 [Liparis tanakae]